MINLHVILLSTFGVLLPVALVAYLAVEKFLPLFPEVLVMSLTVNCMCGHVFATITGRHVYVLHTIETAKKDSGLFLICPKCQSPNAISERQEDLLRSNSTFVH